MQREALRNYLDELLVVNQFRDYCPNGLQVEGRAEIGKIVCGVTASQALLDVAVSRQADAVIVHHGYFWHGEDYRLIGMKRARLASLLKNDINLFAYHLPLDAHPQLGNNTGLAECLGFIEESRAGEQNLLSVGKTAEATDVAALSELMQQRLKRAPLVVGDTNKSIRRIAWCTGGAQDFIEQAIAEGVDAYVSGEISERTTHIASENGIAYFAAGHHATERFGVMALAAHCASLGLITEFVDIANPV